MTHKYETVIIDKLLNKFEQSKSFIGNNKNNQKFSIKVSTLFPEYIEPSNYEVFNEVNEAIYILVLKKFIIAKANPANVYTTIYLSLNTLEKIYEYAHRAPKKDINISVSQLLESYKDKNGVLNRYCKTQIERLKLNKPVQFFNNDLTELVNILIAVDELLKVDKETFVRDFSVRVFNDSKKFESLKSKIVNLLYEYGEFFEKEAVLGSLNIIKNPTYVNFKGAGIISIKGQKIDLTKLCGDIAISSIMLPDIEDIIVTGKAVITIENLTSFHTFNDNSMFAIYLGGYHNLVRREFIKKIYEQNSNIDFYHFGDIDAGGFYILEHLRRETTTNFKPYKMDIETLKEYQHYSKKLTDNDRERLLRLEDSQYGDVISYMLENNCKLEQEAINII